MYSLLCALVWPLFSLGQTEAIKLQQIRASLMAQFDSTAIANYQLQDTEAGQKQLLTDIGRLIAKGNPYTLDIIHYAEQRLSQLDKPPKELRIKLNQLEAKFLASTGNISIALKQYTDALLAAEEANIPELQASIALDLANLISTSGNQQRSMAYYSYGFRIYEKLGDDVGKAKCLSGIADCYDLLGEPRKAKRFYLRALRSIRTTNDDAEEGAILTNLGTLFLAYEQVDSAKAYFQRAQSEYERSEPTPGFSTLLYNYTYLYLNYGATDSALYRARQNLQLATQLDAPQPLIDAELMISYVYRSIDSLQQALAHYDSYVFLKDSIHQQQNRVAIASQDAYAQAQAQAARKRKQRSLQMTGITLLAVLLPLGLIGLRWLKLSEQLRRFMFLLVMLLAVEAIILVLEVNFAAIIADFPVYQLLMNVVLAGIFTVVSEWAQKKLGTNSTRSFDAAHRPKPTADDIGGEQDREGAWSAD